MNRICCDGIVNNKAFSQDYEKKDLVDLNTTDKRRCPVKIVAPTVVARAVTSGVAATVAVVGAGTGRGAAMARAAMVGVGTSAIAIAVVVSAVALEMLFS